MEQFLNELYLMMANDQVLKYGLSIIGILFAVMFFMMGWTSWAFPWKYLEKKDLLDPLVAKIMYWLPAGCILYASIIDRPFYFDINLFGTSFGFQMSFALVVICVVIGFAPIGMFGAVAYAHYRLIFKRDTQDLRGLLIPLWGLVAMLIIMLYYGNKLFYYN